MRPWLIVCRALAYVASLMMCPCQSRVQTLSTSAVLLALLMLLLLLMPLL